MRTMEWEARLIEWIRHLILLVTVRSGFISY